MTVSDATENLFSYGTLQLEAVQLATFGRCLAGHADRLPGYRLEKLKIQDAAVIATSGQTHHPILVRTNESSNTDAVEGSVFALTPDELKHADAYEVADYQRVSVTLASGRQAWVYVAASSTP
jgi:gamma-glutamylcyclotransferase (GGCT)/AIG2-like uncharacterized protein YtfP